MLSQIKNEREGLPLIARTETYRSRAHSRTSSPRAQHGRVRAAGSSDIDEINRLMEYYSFRTPQLATACRPAPGRYAMRFSPSTACRCCCAKQRQQLSAAGSAAFLADPRCRVAPCAARGIYSLTSSQIASGDGPLYLALQKQIAGESGLRGFALNPAKNLRFLDFPIILKTHCTDVSVQWAFIVRVQGNHSPAGLGGSAPTSNSRFLLHLALVAVANAPQTSFFVLAADLLPSISPMRQVSALELEKKISSASIISSSVNGSSTTGMPSCLQMFRMCAR